MESKDIALPPSMMRSMSKQAETEHERRARVIAAEGEFQASQRLTDAAATADTPARCGSATPLSTGLDDVRLDGAGETVPQATPDEAATTPAPGRVTTPTGPTEPTDGSVGVSLKSNANANGSATRARLARERRENWPTPRPAGDGPAN